MNKNKNQNKKKMKKRFKIPLIIVGVFVALVVGLFSFMYFKMLGQGFNIFTGERINNDELIAANLAAPSLELDEAEMFTEKDLIQIPDEEGMIELTVENGKDIVVNQEGTYAVSGSFMDTMIVVEVADNEKVQLFFEGVSIVNESKPAVYVKSADKVFVTTSDSENNIEVTGTYEADGETNLDAVVYSKSDIVLNGLGTLNISSEAGNGISTKDDLKITGGTYNINALDDGLEANDSIRIYDGELNITSSNDAMHSENDEDESKGYIYIEGGSINIDAGDDAIRGNSAVIINGGEISIETCKEGIEATQIRINDGQVTLYSTDDGINATSKTSYRVIAEVNGGVVNIEMANGDTDGFDSDGDLTINGGEINVEGGMAAFDIDGIIEFNDGDVKVDGIVQTEIVTQQIGFGSKFKSK